MSGLPDTRSITEEAPGFDVLGRGGSIHVSVVAMTSAWLFYIKR